MVRPPYRDFPWQGEIELLAAAEDRAFCWGMTAVALSGLAAGWTVAFLADPFQHFWFGPVQFILLALLSYWRTRWNLKQARKWKIAIHQDPIGFPKTTPE